MGNFYLFIETNKLKCHYITQKGMHFEYDIKWIVWKHLQIGSLKSDILSKPDYCYISEFGGGSICNCDWKQK